MTKPASSPVEVTFAPDELIVSKTDLKGNITYANRVFMKVCNLSEPQLLNHPHNLIRHPDMPKGVFYGLWKALKSGNEFFGFVKNMTSDGHFYWVFANITPDYLDDKAIGYYSVRRNAPKKSVNTIESIYAQMREIERTQSSKEAGKASWEWLEKHIKTHHNMSYEQSIISLYQDNI